MQASAGMQASAYEELVWRKGDGCERSYKIPALTKEQIAQLEQQAQTDQQMQAEQQSPEYEEQRIVPDGFRKVSTKREEANSKINERYLVGQATQNPFMPNNNYVQDIENQMNFLTPQKSG